MNTSLWTTYDLDEYVSEEPDSDIVIKCPKCNFNAIHGIGEQDDTYSVGFALSCDGGHYMGIESYKRVDSLDPEHGDFCYDVQLVEFTHYNTMDNCHYETDTFKELEKKWLAGSTVWGELKPHVFVFDDIDKVYNKTFLTTTGEFHFGFD